MKNVQITIEQLAEKLGETVWSKGDLKRIYLNDAGWNTKRMSTKTFILQDENGDFKVSCKIDCPSQNDNWIISQEKEVKERIYGQITCAIFEIENPEGDYDAYCKELGAKKEAEAEKQEQNQYTEKQQEIVNLSSENVRKFLKKQGFIEKSKNELLWNVEYWCGQVLVNNRLLEKDDYAPFIPPIEKIFLKNERQANSGNFFEKIDRLFICNGIIENGRYKQIPHSEELVEWTFARKQGTNGPNKKNVFVPVAIPQSIQKILNKALKEAQEYRKNYLAEQKIKYQQELENAIIEYKKANLK